MFIRGSGVNRTVATVLAYTASKFSLFETSNRINLSSLPPEFWNLCTSVRVEVK